MIRRMTRRIIRKNDEVNKGWMGVISGETGVG